MKKQEQKFEKVVEYDEFNNYSLPRVSHLLIGQSIGMVLGLAFELWYLPFIPLAILLFFYLMARLDAKVYYRRIK